MNQRIRVIMILVVRRPLLIIFFELWPRSGSTQPFFKGWGLALFEGSDKNV